MKILHITPEAPGYSSGGRLGVLQTKESIVCAGNIVDYIGPYIEEDELKAGYRNLYFLQKNKNILKLVLNIFKGITNRSYDYWNRLKINYSDYDYVVLDFSKQDYILEKVPSEKLIVRVHNVEYDFSNRAYCLNKSVKNYIVKKLSNKQERTLLEAARRVVTLTNADKNRLCELYKIDQKKIVIIPVCTKEVNPIIVDNGKTMIITGSLWFGGNYEGIKWFINNVFDKLDKSLHLIVAGSNPNEELKSIIKAYPNIELVANPESMEKYFTSASVAIAPVFEGAGMKVKVAEAWSYGLPVISTEHALIGYRFEEGRNSFCANTPEEFIKDINSYFSLDADEILSIRRQAIISHRENNSMNKSRMLWKEILKGD